MKTRFLLLLLLLIVICPARADLTATVYPGYTFSSSERPTVTTLNLLGMPTIFITGTLGGTNVSLAAESVSSIMLQAGLVDDVTIMWNGDSPRELAVKTNGISTNQINAALAGNGLRGGGGTNLSVAVDGVTINITNDVLSIPLAYWTNFVNAVLTNTAPTNVFISSDYNVGTGTIANTNHGFGRVPQRVNWVLICTNGDTCGYTPGDEIPIYSMFNHDDDPVVAAGANSSNVFLSLHMTDFWQLARKTNDASATFTATNWNVRCYARP